MERRQWAEVAAIVPPVSPPPDVTAMAIWARGLGQARSGHLADALAAAGDLQRIEEQLRTAGNGYWATHVRVMKQEIGAWYAQAAGRYDDAVARMRQDANEEDALEKLPVTPGPIVPAREQLSDLLLQQGHPDLAYKEFHTALGSAPGRRDALRRAEESAETHALGEESCRLATPS